MMHEGGGKLNLTHHPGQAFLPEGKFDVSQIANIDLSYRFNYSLFI